MNGFEKRSAEKKAHILDVTFQLLNTPQGVNNVTTEKVADLAQVSKATIFKYFGTKEQLILEVFKKFLNEIGESAREIFSKNLSFEATFHALTESKIVHLQKVDQQFYLDLMAYYSQKNSGELSKLMQLYNQQSLDLMLELFHRGKKEGKVDLKYSDEFLILYFQTLTNGLGDKNIYERILPYTQEFTEILIKGLAPTQ